MKKNKIILKHCPNFYKIINFEFLEEDSISAKLIGIYENFIFDVDVESQSDIKTVEKLDFVINKYIDDYSFRKEMQRSLLSIRVTIMFFNGTSETPDGPIEYLPNPYRRENLAFSFQMKLCAEAMYPGYTRNIYFARWI